MKQRFSLVLALFLGSSGMLSGCKTGSKSRAPAASEPTSWNRFVQDFLSGYFKERPDLAVNAGKHEFDGQFPDWTPAGFSRYTAYLKTMRAAAQQQTVRGERESFEREYL